MSKGNIVLVGMPGSGKSTIGRLLAEQMVMSFIDTDKVLEERVGKNMQHVIDVHGNEKALDLEESAVRSLDLKNFVVATGGSVIYREGSINHLRNNGTIVYLKLPLDAIHKRIKNPTTRGIVMKKGQDFSGLYHERTPLYEKYADIVIDCHEKDKDAIVKMIQEGIKVRAERQKRIG